jgi:hypothetical protein
MTDSVVFLSIMTKPRVKVGGCATSAVLSGDVAKSGTLTLALVNVGKNF